MTCNVAIHMYAIAKLQGALSIDGGETKKHCLGQAIVSLTKLLRPQRRFRLRVRALWCCSRITQTELRLLTVSCATSDVWTVSPRLATWLCGCLACRSRPQSCVALVRSWAMLVCAVDDARLRASIGIGLRRDTCIVLESSTA